MIGVVTTKSFDGSAAVRAYTIAFAGRLARSSNALLVVVVASQGRAKARDVGLQRDRPDPLTF